MKAFFRKGHFFGIDLGSSSVKVVELAQREGRPALIRSASKEIPPSGDPASREKQIVSALKELVKAAPVKKSKFVVCINCPETVLRVMTLPPMPQGEMKEAVRLEAKRHLPFPIEESIIDFETLGETTEQGIKKVQVAVAASPRKTVHETLSLLKKAGIRPSSLIPVPSALQKMAGSSLAQEQKVQCLMDIGERHTELVILKGSRLIFSRKIPVAGRDFTQAMRGVLVSDRGRTQLTQEEAEQIKREVGIPAEGGDRMIEEKISAAQVLAMVRTPLEQIVSEMDRCFDYYREETRSGRIDSVVLLGRGSRLKGLGQSLSEGLGVEVKLGEPLERLNIEAQIVKPEGGFSEFAAALGAALSFGRGVNLLPPEIKEEIRRALVRATIQSAVVTVVFLCAFFYIGMKIQLANFEKRIAVAKLELGSLGTELERAAVKSLVNREWAQEPYWEDVFMELSHRVPGDIQLTRLEMADRQLVLKGRIASSNREEVLSAFIQDLEKGIFKNVKLVSAKETSDKLAGEFELNAGVD